MERKKGKVKEKLEDKEIGIMKRMGRKMRHLAF